MSSEEEKKRRDVFDKYDVSAVFIFKINNVFIVNLYLFKSKIFVLLCYMFLVISTLSFNRIKKEQSFKRYIMF